MRGLLAVLVLVAAFGGAPAARAQAARSSGTATAEARDQFGRGARAFEAKNYDEAIERFERAYSLSSAPALLLNIAQAYRLKGSCAQALSFYRRFLVLEPQSPHRSEVEGRVAEMRACKEEPPPPAPPPMTTTTDPTTSTGSITNITATPPPSKVESTPPPPEPAASKPPAPSESAASETWTTVGWVGAGAGVVGAGVAVTTLALMLDRKSKLDAACDSGGGCPVDQRSRIDEYTTLRTVSIVSGIGAALGTGVAVYGFWRAGASRGKGAPPALGVWVSPSQIGVRGAFE
jgi:hypothetical protein